jgi:hypothetical protein
MTATRTRRPPQPGDIVVLVPESGVYQKGFRTATVTTVDETRRAFFTRTAPGLGVTVDWLVERMAQRVGKDKVLAILDVICPAIRLHPCPAITGIALEVQIDPSHYEVMGPAPEVSSN